MARAYDSYQDNVYPDDSDPTPPSKETRFLSVHDFLSSWNKRFTDLIKRLILLIQSPVLTTKNLSCWFIYTKARLSKDKFAPHKILDDISTITQKIALPQRSHTSRKITFPRKKGTQPTSKNSHTTAIYLSVMVGIIILFSLWPTHTRTYTLPANYQQSYHSAVNPHRKKTMSTLEKFSPCPITNTNTNSSSSTNTYISSYSSRDLNRDLNKVGLSNLSYNKKINSYLSTKIEQDKDKGFPGWARVTGSSYELDNIQECLYSSQGYEERYSVGISFEKFFWKKNNVPIESVREFFSSYMKKNLKTDDIVHDSSINGVRISTFGTPNSSTCEVLIEGNLLIHLDQTRSRACTILETLTRRILTT